MSPEQIHTLDPLGELIFAYEDLGELIVATLGLCHIAQGLVLQARIPQVERLRPTWLYLTVN